jgi:RHS repeat-associated protein
VYPDALNRLDHTVGDTSTVMHYDTMGRLSTWGTSGNSSNLLDYTTQQAGCTYYANAQPHALRHNTQGSWNTSICYDANGNMARVGYGQQTLTWVSYTWTSYNQPAQIAAVFAPNQYSNFSYDHNHQRWHQIANYGGSTGIETTEYVGGSLEKMTNASGTAYRFYVPAGNNYVVYNRWNTGSNPIYYVTRDHLGSTALITDHTGALVANVKYSALGWNENSSTDHAKFAAVTRHGYTGQEDTYNVGGVNMNGRIYGGGVLPGLFLSPDPYIPDRTNTISYNRYAYVNYNPLTLVDPSGFDDCPGGMVCVNAPYENSPSPLDTGPVGDGSEASGGSLETIVVHGSRYPNGTITMQGNQNQGSQGNQNQEQIQQCINNNQYLAAIAAGAVQGAVTAGMLTGFNPLAIAVGAGVGGVLGYGISTIDSDSTNQAVGRGEFGAVAGLTRNVFSGGSLVGAFTGGAVGGLVTGATGDPTLGAAVGGIVGGANGAAMTGSSLAAGARLGGTAGFTGAVAGAFTRGLAQFAIEAACQAAYGGG